MLGNHSCPERLADYAVPRHLAEHTMPLSALLEQYLAGPPTLRNAVKGMTRDQLKARPVAGRWSTIEVIAHLADFEPIFAERMMRTISHERPLLLTADENLFASTLNYLDRDVEEELSIIEWTRKKMARILRGLKPDTANRVGVHAFKGLVSLEAQLTSAVNHIPHHVPFIEEKRKALGIAG
jgi:DinB family protein